MSASPTVETSADVSGASVPTTPSAPAGGSGAAADAAAITPTARALFRRGRTWVVLAAVLAVGVIALFVLQGGIGAPGGRLDPESPGAAGSGALVEVLRAHDVEVAVARSLGTALDAVDRAGDATVLLYDEFGTLDAARLDELAGSGARLVVVEPGFRALEELAPGVRLAGAAEGAIDDVSCGLGAATRAEELSDGQRLLTIDDDAREAGWNGCFAEGDGFAAAIRAGDGGVAGASDAVSLVASTTVFENSRIDEAGNAAFAIGLLGTTPDLVWYLPGPGDAEAVDAPTLGELTPGWVSPVLVLATVVAVVAGLWRGRRFGPLVVERLPVTVRVGESTQGRARLYARSAQRTHALDQMRMAAIGRLATLLRLPRTTDATAIAQAAATATGRDATSVVHLLVDEAPDGDGRFVELARALDDLEHDVAAAVRPTRAVHGGPAAETSTDDPPGRQR